jgi:hypothetical protein
MLGNPIEVGDVVEVSHGQFGGGGTSFAIVTTIEEQVDKTTEVGLDIEGDITSRVYHNQNCRESPRKVTFEEFSDAEEQAREGYLQRLKELYEQIRKVRIEFNARKLWFETTRQKLTASG